MYKTFSFRSFHDVLGAAEIRRTDDFIKIQIYVFFNGH